MLAWLTHLWLLLTTVIVPVSHSYNLPTKPVSPPTPSKYQVIRIIDGDTIEVKTATGSASVRFLGVNAPELTTGDCLAQAAKDKLTQLIGKNPVFLTADPLQPNKDKYGRLLRYVSIDGKTDLSTQLIAVGLAHFYDLETDYALETQFHAAENSARAAKIGLWSPTACKPAGFCENLPVLVYHHIQPLNEARQLGHAALTVDSTFFEKHLQYLNDRHYTLYTVDQLVTAIKNHQALPSRSVVITIDDAYDDAYNYAYPLLKKYGAVASLFVPTGLVSNPGYLNWGQIAEMNNDHTMPSYDHTWSHYSLPAGNDTKVTSEITTSQSQLEEHLGQVPKILAYPYGSHNTRVITILKSLGFTAAFTTIPGRWQCEGNIMTLPRIHIGNSALSAYGL